MKKINIKLVVTLICMTFGLIGSVEGQIRSNEALFYVRAGESLLNDPSITYVYVDNSTNKIFVMFTRISYIEKKGVEYFDNPSTVRNWNATKLECTFSEKMSRNNKNVYLRYAYGYLSQVYVISDDKSSLVAIPRWEEAQKEQYILVDRNKFNTQKESNYDFLYE